jgi:pimeloyl-ACP methyl ester carboxylesterase
MSGAAEAVPFVRGPQRRSMQMWDGDVSYLAWEDASPKAPVLHFAHANGFNALTYRLLLGQLAGGFRGYASDLRGHGLTTLKANPKGMHSWLTYRDDILRWMEAFDGRAKLLAGHSLGATASLMAAIAKPGMVTGLVLVEPVIMPPSYLRWMKIMRAFGLLDRVFPLVAQAQRRRSIWPNRLAMFEAYRGRGAFKGWPEQVVRDYIDGGTLDFLDGKQVRLACTPGWEAANYRAGAPNVWKYINQLRCPVTLIVGGKRSTCPEFVIEMLLQARPGMRVVRVPEASHFLPMEYPEIVLAEIRAMAALSHA